MTDVEILNRIIANEGGYVHHPADKGGPTNWGITQATLARVRGHWVSEDDVKALTEIEARSIYQQLYVTVPGFDKIRDGWIRAVVVDDAVLSGIKPAIRNLQTVLKVSVDGVMGPETISAVNAIQHTPSCVASLVKGRCLRYARICQHTPSQLVFLPGWLTRALNFL